MKMLVKDFLNNIGLKIKQIAVHYRVSERTIQNKIKKIGLNEIVQLSNLLTTRLKVSV